MLDEAPDEASREEIRAKTSMVSAPRESNRPVVRSSREENASSTTGAFTFADLPPGAYYVAAIADDLPDNWQLPATLDVITRVATRVVVADGAKVNQSLTSRPLR